MVIIRLYAQTRAYRQTDYFNVATSENFTDKNGERQEKTEWHRIVAWGKTAELCGEYLQKGRQVYLEGRLQTRQWDDKEGQKRFTTEIVANVVQFLGARGDAPVRDVPGREHGEAAPAREASANYAPRAQPATRDAAPVAARRPPPPAHAAPAAEKSFDYGPPPMSARGFMAGARLIAASWRHPAAIAIRSSTTKRPHAPNQPSLEGLNRNSGRWWASVTCPEKTIS